MTKRNEKIMVRPARPRVHVLEREQVVSRPLQDVFEFFSRARNLELLTPHWLRFEVLTPEPIEMAVGTVIDYRLHLHRVPLRWRSQIEAWEAGRMFIDRQLRGPYRLWRHQHEFEDLGGATRVLDRVEYALPLGRLGGLARRSLVERDLERIFAHRRDAVRSLLG